MAPKKSSKQDGEKQDTYVYIKDPDFAWIPAKLISSLGDKATVSIPQYKDEQAILSDGGRGAKTSLEATINLKDYQHKVLPLQNVDGSGNLQAYADMVHLPYLHEVSSNSLLVLRLNMSCGYANVLNL
jgi:hypothetical protein